jgi:hypothetical protein
VGCTFLRNNRQRSRKTYYEHSKHGEGSWRHRDLLSQVLLKPWQ